MEDKLTLECSYTPADFFEESFEYSENAYRVEIGNGRVIVTLSDSAGDRFESLCREIHEEIGARFLGAQLDSNEPYQLSGYTTTLRRPDGHVEATFSANATLRQSAILDTVLLDSAGNIKTDTKKERIEARKQNALRASKHRKNPLASSLLKSYAAAITHPQDAFTHLYEIRDTLAKKFGGDDKARSTLNIAKDQWSRLGYLANEAPLSQGRHRGKKLGQLRDATNAEMEEARAIAKHMILAYQTHLDRR